MNILYTVYCNEASMIQDLKRGLASINQGISNFVLVFYGSIPTYRFVLCTYYFVKKCTKPTNTNMKTTTTKNNNIIT